MVGVISPNQDVGFAGHDEENFVAGLPLADGVVPLLDKLMLELLYKECVVLSRAVLVLHQRARAARVLSQCLQHCGSSSLLRCFDCLDCELQTSKPARDIREALYVSSARMLHSISSY